MKNRYVRACVAAPSIFLTLNHLARQSDFFTNKLTERRFNAHAREGIFEVKLTPQTAEGSDPSLGRVTIAKQNPAI